MRKFLKSLIIFVYLFFAIFIQPNNVLASENIIQNYSQQYFVSSTKTETSINRKEKEYYTLFDNRNKTEITSLSNKNNCFGFGSFAQTNVNYNITNTFINDNTPYPVCISHNISTNLKNAINTRAP